MQSNGWWDEQGFLAAQEAGPEQKKATVTSQTDHAQEGNLSLRTELQQTRHRNWLTWDSVLPKNIRLIIECLEPVSLQRSALMAKLRAVGQRECPAKKLIALAERMVTLASTGQAFFGVPMELGAQNSTSDL